MLENSQGPHREEISPAGHQISVTSILPCPVVRKQPEKNRPVKAHGCVPRNPSLPNQVVSWLWQEALGYDMETERIPRDWVKTRKGLDLTLVTSVRDGWNIPEELIALAYASRTVLFLYAAFSIQLWEGFCLTGLKDVPGVFPLEHKAPSKVSSDLWNVSSPRHTYFMPHAIAAPDNTLRSCKYILVNIISIHFFAGYFHPVRCWF